MKQMGKLIRFESHKFECETMTFTCRSCGKVEEGLKIIGAEGVIGTNADDSLCHECYPAVIFGRKR